MAGKSNTFETDLLSLLLTGTAIANVADNAASSPTTSIWVSLHTADPGEAGTQGTSEATYGGYTRIATARTTAGWSVASGAASPVSAITFPEANSTSTSTLTHFAVGLTSASTGGKIFYSGTISPNISIGSGVQPRLTTSSSITED